jgi:hypothetical protein
MYLWIAFGHAPSDLVLFAFRGAWWGHVPSGAVWCCVFGFVCLRFLGLCLTESVGMWAVVFSLGVAW